MLYCSISVASDLKAQVTTSLRFEISDLRSRSAGGGEGIRTPDPCVANAVLCQLSYTPESIAKWRLPIANLRCRVMFQPAFGNWKSAMNLVAGAGFEPATFGL